MLGSSRLRRWRQDRALLRACHSHRQPLPDGAFFAAFGRGVRPWRSAGVPGSTAEDPFWPACRRLTHGWRQLRAGTQLPLQRRRWLEGRHAGGDPCRLSSFTEENRDLRTRCYIPARAGPKVDTGSKVDVACVKSLRLCLHGVYPQTPRPAQYSTQALAAVGAARVALPRSRAAGTSCWPVDFRILT